MSRLATYSKRAVLAAVVVFALAIPVAYDWFRPGISWNGSESLPVGLYWHTDSRLPARIGDVVCTHYDPPAWAKQRDYLPSGLLICKKVLGVAGEQIRRVADRIEICGAKECRDVGRIAAHDRRGRPVIAAALPDTIPSGFVYLGSRCSTMSFDSRYLGLVSESQLVRTLHPLVVDAANGC